MKMRNALAALLGLLAMTWPSAAGDITDKADDKASVEALAKSLKDADALFTADIGKVVTLGQTNSIPATVFGNVAFKDAKILKGKLPAGPLSFSYREGGSMNWDLDAKGKVLIAANGKGVLAIVPATEANLALVKKATDAVPEK